ncbi:MAG TPA: hypothetical protein VHK88_20040 [Aquihabitans sp.]|nr:hypothetical protein [Aquihabitans sp.]
MLPTSVPRIDASASSSLPTPTTSLGGPRGKPNRETARRRLEDEGRRCLDDAVTMLPTPTAGDSVGSRNSTARRRPDSTGNIGDTLTDAVWKTHGAPEGALVKEGSVPLLPTPAVNDMGEGKTVEAWDEWTGKMREAHGNGNGHGKSLAIEAQRLTVTPQEED